MSTTRTPAGRSEPAPGSAIAGLDGRSIYAREILPQVPRLVGYMNREPDSIGAGDVDREHWAWKFRDFPITMLQAAVHPLALLWRCPHPANPLRESEQVIDWVSLAIEATCRRQHANGAFDSVGPFTQDHGVTLGIVHALAGTVRALGDRLPQPLRERVVATVRRACRFALRSREDYAFINNHQALYALAYLEAAELLDDPRYRGAAEAVIDRILGEQSADGWYPEYRGPDPGYETLGLTYLAQYWKRTGSGELLDSLRRSIEFLAYCIHPDGSIGGSYGSRHTALYYPGGLEVLAGAIPLAGTVARHMRRQIVAGRVLTPAGVDAHNLPPLLRSYLYALDACSAGDPEGVGDEPALPCAALEGMRHFQASGITFAGSSAYYAVVNASKGGVCRVFDRKTGRIAYEDAGYLIRTGARRWSSQGIGLGRRIDASDDASVACATRFAEVRQEALTPLKFVVLRVLNLTLFRSVRLGILVRGRIVRRLITGVRPAPLRLTRRIAFDDNEVRFVDRIEADRRVTVDAVALPRRFTPLHMGSTRYYDPAELVATPAPRVDALARDLNETGAADLAFSLRFSGTAPAELTMRSAVGPSGPGGPGIRAEP